MRARLCPTNVSWSKLQDFCEVGTTPPLFNREKVSPMKVRHPRDNHVGHVGRRDFSSTRHTRSEKKPKAFYNYGVHGVLRREGILIACISAFLNKSFRPAREKMGNVCCGNKEEGHKSSALTVAEEHDDYGERGATASKQQPQFSQSLSLSQHHQQQQQQTSLPPPDEITTTDPVELARLEAAREEEARLQHILQTAGRAMVNVRSTRGSTAYYDQGFAAALGQHLEQTTQFPDQIPTRLPLSHKLQASSSVSARLAKPQWKDVMLGDKEGLAGCAGENPNTYLDQKAEAFLDQVRPKKENLFAGARPMVENLL